MPTPRQFAKQAGLRRGGAARRADGQHGRRGVRGRRCGRGAVRQPGGGERSSATTPSATWSAARATPRSTTCTRTARPFPEADCPLLAPRPTGEPVRVEQDWFVRRDGSFVPVAYSSAPVTIGARRGAVVVFRDISERNRAEAERLRAEAIHASRARIVQADARRAPAPGPRPPRRRPAAADQRHLRAPGRGPRRRRRGGAARRSPRPWRRPSSRSGTCATSAPGSIRRCSPTGGWRRRSRR